MWTELVKLCMAGESAEGSEAVDKASERDFYRPNWGLLPLPAARLCVRAGFFLFAVQPFRLGDRVAVSYSTPAAAGGRAAWFEGTCEKVDLRCGRMQCQHRLSPPALMGVVIGPSRETKLHAQGQWLTDLMCSLSLPVPLCLWPQSE